MNNAFNASTGQVPHLANLGRHPRMSWNDVKIAGRSDDAMIQATHLQTLHKAMSKDIMWAEQRMTRYYDTRRADTPSLQVGERLAPANARGKNFQHSEQEAEQ
ncbi:hypothetical protein V1525DRAFT_414974 [Lipomyces kononenkoae]|uniref:Uncharacterized protein n=1 Tax=Lipomyces kononenkoae TaxID=34357 RepID=A0ACC3SQF2_LIPKO